MKAPPFPHMTHKIKFIADFQHRRNGECTLYRPGDVGEFDEPLANSLAYEGLGHFFVVDEKSEGDAPANKAKKAAPENKGKK